MSNSFLINPFYNPLFESMSSGSKKGNENAYKEIGEVNVYNYSKKEYEKVNVFPLIKCVNDAKLKFEKEYPYLFLFLSKCATMFIDVFPCKITDTMCVDDYNNLWINFTFVYNDCKSDSNVVFGILFHEMMHIALNHLNRFKAQFPDETFNPLSSEMKRNLNIKSNLAMDYEVNSSMVEDEIVTPDFFKQINGLYKKKYAGMRYEEILDFYGDDEYEEWRKANGSEMGETEKKIMKAIEEASNVLGDKSSTDEQKEKARKDLKRKMDELLGRPKEPLQKSLEDMKNVLSEIGDCDKNIDNLMDDLFDGTKMSSDKLSKTLEDIDDTFTDMYHNAEEIGKKCGKSTEDAQKDIAKAAKKIRKNLKKLNESGLSKEEKEDLTREIQDLIEDVTLSRTEKAKKEEERANRDAEIAEKRKEELKKKNPMNKLLIIVKNLLGLEDYGRICDETIGSFVELEAFIEHLVDEKTLTEINKDDFDELMPIIKSTNESLEKDFESLIDNEIIIRKTKGDMIGILNDCFSKITEGLNKLNESDDEIKKAGVLLACKEFRTIGKILKTQKRYRTTKEFKDAYREEVKKLMDMYKSGDKTRQELFELLFDNGFIIPMYLDKNGQDRLKRAESRHSSSPPIDLNEFNEFISKSGLKIETEMDLANPIESLTNLKKELESKISKLNDSDKEIVNKFIDYISHITERK